MRAQLRDGTMIPIGLLNAFDEPLVQGKDADAPAPAGSIPALSAGVEAWKPLFEAMKLTAAEVGAIGPDVCGPDAAAAEAMLRADPAYAKALDDMAASRKALGRSTFEITYVRAYNKVRRCDGFAPGDVTQKLLATACVGLTASPVLRAQLWQRGFKVDTYKYCYPLEKPKLPKL